MGLSRRHEVYSENGVEVSYDNVSWEYVRDRRDKALFATDLWYLSDRWVKLTDEEQEQLNGYRQALRDLPQTHFDESDEISQGANEGADNFPEPEDWF